MLVVVKSDGYGHGAVPSAQAALDAGAEGLAVSTIAEGMALRLAGIHAPVFVMGMTTPDGARFAARYDLTPMLCELATIDAYAQAVHDLDGRAQCWLKVDTGMGRLGCEPGDAADLARAIPAFLGPGSRASGHHGGGRGGADLRGDRGWGQQWQ